MDDTKLLAKIKRSSKSDLDKMLCDVSEAHANLVARISGSGFDVYGSFVTVRPLWQHSHPPMGKTGFEFELRRLRGIAKAIHVQMHALDPSHVVGLQASFRSPGTRVFGRPH